MPLQGVTALLKFTQGAALGYVRIGLSARLGHVKDMSDFYLGHIQD